MIKNAVEQMQFCKTHFYQKIARKKVARVNAVLCCSCRLSICETDKVLNLNFDFEIYIVIAWSNQRFFRFYFQNSVLLSYTCIK